MAAVVSAQVPGSFQPFTLLNGNSAVNRDSGTLKVLLAEPLEFKETASVVTSLDPGSRGWIEVNPPPKSAKPGQPSSVVAPSEDASSSSPSKSNKKILYSGSIPLTFPDAQRTLGIGLANHGNTCYLNSALQAVIHTPGLAHLLIAHKADECALKLKGKYCTMCSLRLCQVHSFNKPLQQYYPSVLTKHLKQIGKPLRPGRQEDSHEFLRFLIDGLQNSELSMHTSTPDKMNGDLKYTSSIHQLFGGRLRSRVTCQKCQHPSDTFDAFLDLSVEVRQCRSVKNAFDKFIKMDRLEGQNKYKCDKCKVLVNATKQLTIDEAPKALVVHLKRFSPTGGKIRDQVAYDQTFDISPYMSKGHHGARYSLYAVLLHHGGGPHSGHYTARVRSTDGKRWGSMDDSDVSTSTKVPLGLQDAYILFYIREKGDALARAIHTAAPAPQVVNPFAPVASDTGDAVERRYEQQQAKAQQQEQPEAGPSRLGLVNGGGAAVVAGSKRSRDDVKDAPDDASTSGSEEEDDDEDTQSTATLMSTTPLSTAPAPTQASKQNSLPFPLTPASRPSPTSASKQKQKHQPPPSSLNSKPNVPLPPPTEKKKKKNREKKKNRLIDPFGASRAGVQKFEAAKGGGLVGKMKGRDQ